MAALAGRRSAKAVAVCLLAFGLATATAEAGSVAYTSSEVVPLPVSITGTGPAGVSSSLVIPAGRTPIERLQVRDVKLAYPGGGALDMTLALRDPTGGEFPLIASNPSCGTLPVGSAVSFIDGAGSLFGTSPATCPSGGGAVNVRPADPRTLSFFDDRVSPGTWALIVRDPNTFGLPPAHLDGWSLKVTHAFLTLSATAKKQPLKPKLRVKVTCDGNCKLSFGKDGKGGSHLAANKTTVLKVKLKPAALERLADAGGVASIAITATNDLGGSATRTVKVHVA